MKTKLIKIKSKTIKQVFKLADDLLSVRLAKYKENVPKGGYGLVTQDLIVHYYKLSQIVNALKNEDNYNLIVNDNDDEIKYLNYENTDEL